MSNYIETYRFRCSKCQILSKDDDGTITLQSGGFLRMLLPEGWTSKNRDMTASGDTNAITRKMVDFLCPECQKK